MAMSLLVGWVYLFYFSGFQVGSFLLLMYCSGSRLGSVSNVLLRICVTGAVVPPVSRRRIADVAVVSSEFHS